MKQLKLNRCASYQMVFSVQALHKLRKTADYRIFYL